MWPYRSFQTVLAVCEFTVLLLVGCAHPVVPPTPSVVRQHADSAFTNLGQREHQAASQAERTSPADDTGASTSPTFNTAVPPILTDFPPSDYLLATGRGDMNRGASICVRAADMAARAELAKLIRVQVKERSTDRVRERTGRSVEQDIEVIREEQANELLQEVRIVHREVDKTTGSCTSTAAMPKRRIATPPDSSQSSAEKVGTETRPPKTPPVSPN